MAISDARDDDDNPLGLKEFAGPDSEFKPYAEPNAIQRFIEG